MDELSVALLYLLFPIFVGVGFAYIFDRLKQGVINAFSNIMDRIP